MISPASLVKRMSVGSRLVPFFKCVCVYFVALGAGGASTPSAGAVAAKCAPVLCLLLFVMLHHGATVEYQGWYARRIALGLALSALGDALLVWPQHFVAGMGAFAGAHVAYIAAFRFRPLAARAGLACYAATGYYLTLLSPPGGLRALVPLYGALLATMAWRGVARGRARPPPPAPAPAPPPPHRLPRLDLRRAAAAGALLFLLSDAILGYSLFGGPVPYKQVLVMSTYYLGQLGIALSALEPPPPPPPPMTVTVTAVTAAAVSAAAPAPRARALAH